MCDHPLCASSSTLYGCCQNDPTLPLFLCDVISGQVQDAHCRWVWCVAPRNFFFIRLNNLLCCRDSGGGVFCHCPVRTSEMVRISRVSAHQEGTHTRISSPRSSRASRKLDRQPRVAVVIRVSMIKPPDNTGSRVMTSDHGSRLIHAHFCYSRYAGMRNLFARWRRWH